MYTLQSQYLVQRPIQISPLTAIFMLMVGGAGYTTYFIASEQKNLVRDTRGSCRMWGKPAKFIEVEFITKDGVTQKTFLVCSGEYQEIFMLHLRYIMSGND
jgi:7-dehydrocholesterol reductase